MPDYVLFIVGALYTSRIVYLARARGVNVILALVITVLATAVCTWSAFVLTADFSSEGLALLIRIFGVVLGPTLVFLALRKMAPREGARGEAYLNIEFDCPECGNSLSFDRSRRGLTADCIHCGEIVRIPNDEPTKSPKRRKPRGNPSDVVVLRNFTTEHLAMRAQALLEQAGIDSSVANNAAGSALTFLPENSGADLMIELKDWDEALRLLNEDRGDNVDPNEA